MARTTVTVCSCLQIIPCPHVYRYSRYDSRARIELTDNPGVMGIPGTVRKSCSEENDAYSKKIEFSLAAVMPDTTDHLMRLSRSRLIALYVDESGNRRVMGSPTYPATLKWIDEGGVLKVMLACTQPWQDAFVEL